MKKRGGRALSKSMIKTMSTGFFFLFFMIASVLMILLTGCKSGVDEIIIEDLNIPLTKDFTIPQTISPYIHTGYNDRVIIDHSNKHEGYITIKFTDESDGKFKAVITGPNDDVYIYELNPKIIEVYPLSAGNGVYTIGVYENVYDDEYNEILLISIDVILDNVYVPFIRPSQYVMYSKDSSAAKLTAELTAGIDCLFAIIEKVIAYFEENIYYDVELAYIAQPGFIPDVDAVAETGRGFCFDIAALFAAMLRSRGIPAQLVVGYYTDIEYDNMYHAWVSVYSKSNGTIGGVIDIKAGEWNIIDPTFISSRGLHSVSILARHGFAYEAVFIY